MRTHARIDNVGMIKGTRMQSNTALVSSRFRSLCVHARRPISVIPLRHGNFTGMTFAPKFDEK